MSWEFDDPHIPAGLRTALWEARAGREELSDDPHIPTGLYEVVRGLASAGHSLPAAVLPARDPCPLVAMGAPTAQTRTPQAIQAECVRHTDQASNQLFESSTVVQAVSSVPFSSERPDTQFMASVLLSSSFAGAEAPLEIVSRTISAASHCLGAHGKSHQSDFGQD